VRYRWPGNVRELQNEIRRAALLSDGVILESHLSELVRAGLDSLIDSSAVPAEKGTNLPDMVRNLEMREIEKAYRLAKGNKSRAAEMLGLSRFALQRKLDKYQIIADQDETETPQEAAGEATE
jgi:DNA-binding NtrC family response regulator